MLIKFRMIKPRERSDYKSALTPLVLENFKRKAWEVKFP